jgi:ATP-dependent helicase/nuclease subunit B
MPYYHLPHAVPVLESVAARLLAETHGAPETLSRALVFVPTRRAGRALGSAFLRVARGRALLLPRMVAVGDIDTNPLFLAESAGLPPSLPALTRQAALAAMITRNFPEVLPDRALRLAAELAALLDEAAAHDADLSRLDRLAPDRFARHWQKTLRFLSLGTARWAAELARRGAADPQARRNAVLRAIAARLAAAPPAAPVLAVGLASPAPAQAALLAAIAACPQGAVLLPGLDVAMPDSAWEAVGPAHPQAEYRALLWHLALPRSQVRAWQPGPPSARENFLARALAPAQALDWEAAPLPAATAGMTLLQAPDSAAEARAVALAVRHALQAPDSRIAVVTPDRTLAERIAVALARFRIGVEDSAGEKLGRTPAGAFLRLVAEAVMGGLAPVKLLSLLRHPLCAGGQDPADFRAAGRRFERAALRGPRPDGRIVLTAAILPDHWKHDAGIRAAQNAVARALGPLLNLALLPEVLPEALLRATVEAAEALAATDRTPGALRLWTGPEGAALARHVTACAEAARELAAMAPRWWPDLLDQFLAQGTTPSRRSLRGRDAAPHPRVEILGVLEARLLAHDTVILAGLNEGTWPAMPDPGPWLSREQRAELGLLSPDAAVGFAAADFVASACTSGQVIFSRATKVDGEPTVPSRWLTRLSALAGEAALRPEPDVVALAARLDQPAARRREARPAPVPPLAMRPRQLPVTAVETLIANPYAIYARRILKLRPLEPLDQEADAADWGSLVHAVARDFVDECERTMPASPEGAFLRHAERHLTQFNVRPGLVALWRPRLATLAPWFAAHVVDFPARRRLLEAEGSTVLAGPGGDFTLTARADRLDVLADGSLSILDYKTGSVPSGAQVTDGRALQLPLTALIAGRGGFAGQQAAPVSGLSYVRLSGGPDPGSVVSVADAAQVAAATGIAADVLLHEITKYDSGAAYRAAYQDDDFAHLSRMRGWPTGGAA